MKQISALCASVSSDIVRIEEIIKLHKDDFPLQRWMILWASVSNIKSNIRTFYPQGEQNTPKAGTGT
jgi:hypothetical protein